MMPRTSGIWDRSLLRGKECCTYIFKIASSLVFACILPLPDHGYPSVSAKLQGQKTSFLTNSSVCFPHLPELFACAYFVSLQLLQV